MSGVEQEEWYVMRATYRREMIVRNILNEMGIKCYIPMKYVYSDGQARKKVKKLVPAISSLVFVYATKTTMQQLQLKLPYLQYNYNQVDGKKIPMVVEYEQMEQFIALTITADEKMIFFAPGELNLAKGTKVKVVAGDFKGVTGYLVKIDGARSRRVVIDIEGVVTVATLTISIDMVEPA